MLPGTRLQFYMTLPDGEKGVATALDGSYRQPCDIDLAKIDTLVQDLHSALLNCAMHSADFIIELDEEKIFSIPAEALPDVTDHNAPRLFDKLSHSVATHLMELNNVKDMELNQITIGIRPKDTPEGAFVRVSLPLSHRGLEEIVSNYAALSKLAPTQEFHVTVNGPDKREPQDIIVISGEEMALQANNAFLIRNRVKRALGARIVG